MGRRSRTLFARLREYYDTQIFRLDSAMEVLYVTIPLHL